MIHVGQQFFSYESVERAIEDFENKHHVKFVKLRTKYFALSDAPYNMNLRFKRMEFRCVRGGPFRTKSVGVRKKSTIKQGCTAGLELRATSDKMKLEVRKVITKHNHELTQRWVYFKNGISSKLKAKLNLQQVFIRRNLYQLDGNENLVAALVEPRLLATITAEDNVPSNNTFTGKVVKKRKRKKSPIPDQEVLRATEALQLSESNVENSVLELPTEDQSSETNVPVTEEKKSSDNEIELQNNSGRVSVSTSVMQTQKLILNTLNELNQAMQSLASNMTVMTNAISNLNTSLSSITHIILPEEQILNP